MATKIVVPQLGESVVEATISRWLKKEGDAVSPGDVLVELETDKVNLEVGAEHSGVLSRIEKQEGQDVKVGEQIGMIEEGAVAQKPAEAKAPTTQKTSAQPPGASAEPPTSKKAAATPADKLKATPSARRLAQDNNVDLAQIPGSGPGARIDVSDVQRYLDSRKPAATASQEPASVPTPAPALELVRKGAREERERMSRRRRTIAQRMVEAQRTAAILTTYNEVDMTQIMDLRARRKEAFKKQYGIGLGIVSFFVKASIRALKDFPKMNAEIQGDEILYKYYYDIGVAIGATEGLVVPVLRDADRLSFAEIEKAIKEFAEKGEKGTLTLDDLRGGTFTITNGGVFGSLLSSPILNPPQVGILGLHKIEERPVAINHAVVVRPMMYVALSYDHRLIDGRESVQFLARLKELIEDPAMLLVES